MFRWKFLRVVPNVHFGIVEYITQWTITPAEVGVIEVADQHTRHMDHDKWQETKADHGQRNILDRFVYNSLHKMKAKLCGKSHFFYAVVHFVKFPHPGYAVQHTVDVPLDKISDHKHDQELHPAGKLSNLDGHQVLYTKQ